MKKIYLPHNTTIREKSHGLVEVIEDGEYGPGTDRPGMPYSRIVATFESVALARRSFPHSEIDMSFADAFKQSLAELDYHTKAIDAVIDRIAPSDIDTEVEPDPTFDAAHEIRYDDQGVPY